MSTFIEQGHNLELHDASELDHYFDQFTKPSCRKLIGLEAEFLAVNRQSGQALPFQGDSGIEALLRFMSRSFQYQSIFEGPSVIALKRDQSMVTLEPGGQVELSGAPVHSIFELEDQLNSFISELKMVETTFRNLRWISCGIQPFSRLEDISWVPKRRYGFMADYLGKRGSLAHWMMKLTATNQVSLDYEDEADAMDALRTVFMITPFATALFANSNFWEGRFHSYQSRRFEIWQNTDADRTGIPERFLTEGQTFRDYLAYLLDMPMMFVVRNGDWISMEGVTFRRFIQEGYNGLKAMMGDFELHLSTVFPEVRLKQYLEIRGIDAQRPAMIPAVAAFWKGILYDRNARAEARKAVENMTADERNTLIRAISREGIHASAGNFRVLDIARGLTEAAKSGLKAQAKTCGTRDESVFVERIEERILKTGLSPADRFKKACFNDDVALGPEVLEYLAI